MTTTRTLLTLLAILALVGSGSATLITDFDTVGTTSKWVTFEREGSPSWWLNGLGMCIDSHIAMEIDGASDYAAVRWDKASQSNVEWFCMSMTPQVVAATTVCAVRLRGYALDGGDPDINVRLAVWGADAGGTHNWNLGWEARPFSTGTAWTIVNPDLTAELLVSYWTLTMWGGARSTVYGLDIDFIEIDGVDIPQIDSPGGGPGCNWGERHQDGYAHGCATVANVGAPYENVGEFSIYSGDEGTVLRAFRHQPLLGWIDASAEPFVSFDWRAAPGTTPADVSCNLRLFNDGGGEATILGADQTPPADWTHVEIDGTSESWGSWTDVFRLEWVLVDNASTGTLNGIQVDNLQFSASAVAEWDLY